MDEPDQRIRMVSTLDDFEKTLKAPFPNTKICIHECFMSLEGAQRLAWLLAEATHLTHFFVLNCGITSESLEPILGGLKKNQKLHRLDFWSNRFGEKGARVVADYVESNPEVVDLRLVENDIPEIGAIHIGKALAKNNHLQRLTLQLGYNMNDAVAQVYFEALSDNFALRTLELRTILTEDDQTDTEWNIQDLLYRHKKLPVQWSKQIRASPKLAHPLRRQKLLFLGDCGAGKSLTIRNLTAYEPPSEQEKEYVMTKGFAITEATDITDELPFFESIKVKHDRPDYVMDTTMKLVVKLGEAKFEKDTNPEFRRATEVRASQSIARLKSTQAKSKEKIITSSQKMKVSTMPEVPLSSREDSASTYKLRGKPKMLPTGSGKTNWLAASDPSLNNSFSNQFSYEFQKKIVGMATTTSLRETRQNMIKDQVMHRQKKAERVKVKVAEQEKGTSVQRYIQQIEQNLKARKAEKTGTDKIKDEKVVVKQFGQKNVVKVKSTPAPTMQPVPIGESSKDEAKIHEENESKPVEVITKEEVKEKTVEKKDTKEIEVVSNANGKIFKMKTRPTRAPSTRRTSRNQSKRNNSTVEPEAEAEENNERMVNTQSNFSQLYFLERKVERESMDYALVELGGQKSMRPLHKTLMPDYKFGLYIVCFDASKLDHVTLAKPIEDDSHPLASVFYWANIIFAREEGMRDIISETRRLDKPLPRMIIVGTHLDDLESKFDSKVLAESAIDRANTVLRNGFKKMSEGYPGVARNFVQTYTSKSKMFFLVDNSSGKGLVELHKVIQKISYSQRTVNKTLKLREAEFFDNMRPMEFLTNDHTEAPIISLKDAQERAIGLGVAEESVPLLLLRLANTGLTAFYPHIDALKDVVYRDVRYLIRMMSVVFDFEIDFLQKPLEMNYTDLRECEMDEEKNAELQQKEEQQPGEQRQALAVCRWTGTGQRFIDLLKECLMICTVPEQMHNCFNITLQLPAGEVGAEENQEHEQNGLEFLDGSDSESEANDGLAFLDSGSDDSSVTSERGHNQNGNEVLLIPTLLQKKPYKIGYVAKCLFQFVENCGVDSCSLFNSILCVFIPLLKDLNLPEKSIELGQRWAIFTLKKSSVQFTLIAADNGLLMCVPPEKFGRNAFFCAKLVETIIGIVQLRMNTKFGFEVKYERVLDFMSRSKAEKIKKKPWFSDERYSYVEDVFDEYDELSEFNSECLKAILEECTGSNEENAD